MAPLARRLQFASARLIAGNTSLTVTSVTDTTAVLNWTEATGATSYLVGRSGSDNRGNGPYQNYDPSSATSRTFVWLIPDTTYTLFCEPQPGGTRHSVTFTTSSSTAPFAARPTDIPAPIVGRPTGPGYIRYEDLYQIGDSPTQAMNRMGASGIITFPEGEFVGVDFPAATGYASIQIPKRCDGIIGSGKGAVGGSTGTVFTMVPNSSTYTPPPRGQTRASLARVMYRINGERGGLFANFQIKGVEQQQAGKGGGPDGETPFSGFTDYDPYGKTTMQDILSYGWFGDQGAPPGETFGITLHGRGGSPNYHGHKFVRLETDGRRTLGGSSTGIVGFTSQNQVGGYMVDCNFHHGKSAGYVGYQTFDFTSYDCTMSTAGVSQAQLIGPNPINHERTDGIMHVRPQLLRPAYNKGTHITHSNDYWTANYTGTGTRTVQNGQCTIVNPTWTPGVWGSQYMLIESWENYGIGDITVGPGDSMTNPPLVVQEDGVTKIPYMWYHGPGQLVS